MKRALPLLFIVVLIGGCALQPVVPERAIDWNARRDRLSALTDWEARGRIAVKSADEGGQGNIRWIQSAAQAQIRLSGPFGAGAYEISWTADDLVVSSKDGEVTVAYEGSDAAQQFLSDQLGWTFPAISTRYWLLGVPHPGYESLERFDDGWLKRIEQNGWSVNYDSFESHDDLWLPRKIVMENDQARVKLVIDRWVL
jgi:outer membrane lipoprotein LolB